MNGCVYVVTIDECRGDPWTEVHATYASAERSVQGYYVEKILEERQSSNYDPEFEQAYMNKWEDIYHFDAEWLNSWAEIEGYDIQEIA